LEVVEGSGGGRRLWREHSTKLRRQSARSSGDGRKLWKRREALEVSETLEEAEGSGNSQHEALEAFEGSRGRGQTEVKGLGRLEAGGGRRFRRQHITKLWRRQEALEVIESCGGGQRFWRMSKAKG
jgi:hypothetical protein